MGQELRRKAANSLRARDNSAEISAGASLLFMAGADSHPVIKEFPLGHPVTVIGDYDLVLAHDDRAKGGIGVVGILDQLCVADQQGARRARATERSPPGTE